MSRMRMLTKGAGAMAIVRHWYVHMDEVDGLKLLASNLY